MAKFCKQKLSFNIKQEWNRFSMKILPTRIFHNDLVASSCSFDDFIDHKHFNRNLVKNSLDYYSNYLHKWLNHSTSFGLTYQHSLQSIPSRIDQEYNYDHSHIDIGLSLVLFCNQKETLSIQQMLTRTRYHWYRKLSKSPMNSGFQTKLDENHNIFSIYYDSEQIPSTPSLQLDEIIFDRNQFSYSESNLNAEIDEMVHISALLKTLLFYLQPEKLITYNA
ncbi:hypothetical protein SSS_06892 [Sarcoptes scabiei]|uniref:Uncharacterized protein n=1 Tax=Sarcoptes scabiei TaxID=52283 RepID=A0A834VCW5_SARSC|nr:hypothetical protein SSS_06892 [Sarcoptes scabiei]